MNIIGLKDKNLYYVGGVVRDELLGKKSFDTDLVYEGNAIDFASKIENAEILKINEQFGTVRIKINGEQIDIASTRNEKYPQKGHLPKVFDLGCRLKDDVLRRDFTINAMAKSTYDGKIIDYTSGLEDIKDRKIRVLHDKSFIDDPTRIVRGLKFAVRFGFELDEHTQKLQDEYLENINYDMSYKRLKKELIETFNLNSQKAFERFIKQGIYKLISPEEFILPNVDIENLVRQYNPENIWLIYVGLLPDISNLPLTKIEKKIVEDYHWLQNKSFKTDFEIYKNFDRLNLESVLMFAVQNEQIVKRYLDVLHHIKLSISGTDLQNLGIKPCAKYQECFDFVLKEKLKHPQITIEDEIQLVKEFFQ
ncbi:CCA tRNA nucleotidyltransferase [bacterium]|nr:CCA tRNA nucleotidyltransferase [bacterium]